MRTRLRLAQTVEQHLVAELLSERRASPVDRQTLLAIRAAPTTFSLHDLQLAEVQRIARVTRRPRTEQ